MKESEKLVEVYKARSVMEAEVIKSLLASYGIPCLLKTNAAPSVLVFTTDGMGEVKIMVQESMAKEAGELINRDKDV